MNLSWSEQLAKEPVMKPSNFMPFFWSWETRGNGRFGLWPSFQHFHIAIVHLVWWVVQPEQGTEPRTQHSSQRPRSHRFKTDHRCWETKMESEKLMPRGAGFLAFVAPVILGPHAVHGDEGVCQQVGHRSLLGGLFCVWRQTIVRAKLGFTLEEMTWRARNAGTSHDRNVLIAPTTKRIW